MKTPLSEIEQDSLRSRGLITQSEIAYRENGHIYAEDVLSSNKRIINTAARSQIKENKILFG